MDVVVRANGTVGDVHLTKSIDKVHGLDEQAIASAKGWLFDPPRCDGQPVNMLVALIIEFRLH